MLTITPWLYEPKLKFGFWRYSIVISPLKPHYGWTHVLYLWAYVWLGIVFVAHEKYFVEKQPSLHHYGYIFQLALHTRNGGRTQTHACLDPRHLRPFWSAAFWLRLPVGYPAATVAVQNRLCLIQCDNSFSHSRQPNRGLCYPCYNCAWVGAGLPGVLLES